jgi:hypothetical protein
MGRVTQSGVNPPHRWTPGPVGAEGGNQTADCLRVRLSERVIELLPDGDWQTSERVWRGSADFLTLLESRGVLVRGVKRPVDPAG